MIDLHEMFNVVSPMNLRRRLNSVLLDEYETARVNIGKLCELDPETGTCTQLVLLLDDFTHFYRDLNSSTFSKSSTITVTIMLIMRLNGVAAYIRRQRATACGRRNVLHSELHPLRGCSFYDGVDKDIDDILTALATRSYLYLLPPAYSNSSMMLRKEDLVLFDHAEQAHRTTLTTEGGVYFVGCVNKPPKSWLELKWLFTFVVKCFAASYLEKYVVLFPGDHPIQKAARIAQRSALEHQKQGVPYAPNFVFDDEQHAKLFESMVSISGPFHQGLNLFTTLFDKYVHLFDKLHTHLRGRVLPDKPRPRWIHTMCVIMYDGWLKCRTRINAGLEMLPLVAKWPEVATFMFFFDTCIPLVVNHYCLTFLSKDFDLFRQSVAMMTLLVTHWRRRNYNKSMPTWMHYISYWRAEVPAFYERFKKCYYMVDESFIERFNSKLRRRLRDVRSFDSLRRVASNVLSGKAEAFLSAYGGDIFDRHSNRSLDALSDKSSMWIAKLFEAITKSNQSRVVSSKGTDIAADRREALYVLPNIHGEQQEVVADRLPFAYGSSTPPSVAVRCDSCRDKCEVHDVNPEDGCQYITLLTCGHSLHDCSHCRRSSAHVEKHRVQCTLCYVYLSSFIRMNCEKAEKSMQSVVEPVNLSDDLEEDRNVDVDDDDGDNDEDGNDDDDDTDMDSPDSGNSHSQSGVSKKRGRSKAMPRSSQTPSDRTSGGSRSQQTKTTAAHSTVTKIPRKRSKAEIVHGFTEIRTPDEILRETLKNLSRQALTAHSSQR